MKKQEIFMLVGAVIFSISLFAKANKEKQFEDLALENVEALSASELPRGDYEGDDVYFKWNGQHWEGNKMGSSEKKFPQYDYCRDAGTDGHQVYCDTGAGNCWNGTGCIPD